MLSRTWFDCNKMFPNSLLQKAQPFREFQKIVTQNRCPGDDIPLSVIAETSNLVENSPNGIELTNKSKTENTLSVNEPMVDQKMNSPKFLVGDKK